MKYSIIAIICTLILPGAMAQSKPQDADIALMEIGELAKCSAAEGCIVMTRSALQKMLQEAAQKAVKSCTKNSKEWL